MSYRYVATDTFTRRGWQLAFTEKQFRRRARAELRKQAKDQGLHLGRVLYWAEDGNWRASAKVYRIRPRRSLSFLVKIYALRFWGLSFEL